MDCTLRDGGYVNNWQWGFGSARRIIQTLTRAGVDIVEVGFLRNVDGYDPDVTVCNTIEELNRLLPGFADRVEAAGLQGRVGFRPVTPDRLPVVGPVPDLSRPIRGRHVPTLPGLWCIQGFGARGIVWSALMADLLASRMGGEPLPLENDLVAALAPERFLLKARDPEEALPDFASEE